MIRRIILGALLVLSIPALAQKSPVKGIPKECRTVKPTYSSLRNTSMALDYFSSKEFIQEDAPSLGYWDVYSDRDNNTTYITTSTSQPYSHLNFKEKVRIARIKNGYALVYSPDTESADEFPGLPSNPEWKGWIPMSHLVYYDYPLLNSEGLTIQVLLNDSMDFSSRMLLTAKLYQDPSDSSRFVHLPNKSNSIFYLVKEDGDHVLLSTSQDTLCTETIYGWFSLRDVVIWNSRIALEPTWDFFDHAYFASKQISCEIRDVNNKTAGHVDFRSTFARESFHSDYYRMNGGSWRFPLVNATEDNGKASKCAIPGDSDFLDKPTQKIFVSPKGSESSSMPKVNIYFVVDGSRLYEPFFPIMAERIGALEEVSSDIRIGMTIYHDSRSGKFVNESFPLTKPGNEELLEFMDQGGTYGFKDNLSEAPLLQTLESCLDNAGFESSEQNFVIVIGGRGDNSDGDLSPDDLAYRFAEKNITLFALQVQNNPSMAGYRLFDYIMESIIRTSVGDRLNETVQSYQIRPVDSPVVFTTFAPLRNNAVVYESLSSVKNGLMTENVFSNEFNKLMQVIGESISASGSLSSMYPVFFRKANVFRNKDGRKYFKEVALYSEQEFDNLLKVYSMLNELALKNDTDRSKFIDIIQVSIPSSFYLSEQNMMAPYGIAKIMKVLNDYGYLRVFSLIEGLPWIPGSYSGRTLKEISSDKYIEDDEYRYILSDITKRYYRLLEIRNTPSIYRSVINGDHYYWVPKEDLL